MQVSCKLLAWLWRLHLHRGDQTVKRACGNLFNCWSSHIYIPYAVVLLISYIDCTWHWMHALITFNIWSSKWKYSVLWIGTEFKLFRELCLWWIYMFMVDIYILVHPCAQWTAYKLFSGMVKFCHFLFIRWLSEQRIWDQHFCTKDTRRTETPSSASSLRTDQRSELINIWFIAQMHLYACV